MDDAEVARWFRSYLADFAALGRGDVQDVRSILAHYGPPMTVSSDSGTIHLTDEAKVLAFAQQQIGALRSAGYDHSTELAAETTVLNRTCALHRGAFARVRADGSEISRLEATYLITDGPAGRRISALVVHSSG